ncbi:hypothetical protein [Hymenobacter roseosalivarius]|uniref:hypothetical protein n=1 Tax=Hymenobacter roseosalivarius TaxID=89967 RepID=UPI00373FE2F1
MLLTITTTHQPATDLGYLLHKNPGRLQSVDIAYGQAHIFYPEATPERCTAALLLDIDPVALVRNHRGPAGEGFALEQYVNDRPYAASSFLSTALVKAFNTAMNGTCKDRPDLPDTLLPLEATIAALPAANASQPAPPPFCPPGLRNRYRSPPARPHRAGLGRQPLLHAPPAPPGPASARLA